MSYPTYILDLMTLCWSQQPKDRPSASQIVSITQAPELTHLIDVVSLHDQMAVLSACVTALPPKNEGIHIDLCINIVNIQSFNIKRLMEKRSF